VRIGIERNGPLLPLDGRADDRSTNYNWRETRQQGEMRQMDKLTEEQAAMRLTSEDVTVCRSMGINAREFIATRDGDETPLDANGDATDKPEPYIGCSDCAEKHETNRHADEFVDCAKCRAAHGDTSRHADLDRTELDNGGKKLSPEQAAVNATLGISDREFAARHRG
jgi:hypothetical protein